MKLKSTIPNRETLKKRNFLHLAEWNHTDNTEIKLKPIVQLWVQEGMQQYHQANGGQKY